MSLFTANLIHIVPPGSTVRPNPATDVGTIPAPPRIGFAVLDGLATVATELARQGFAGSLAWLALLIFRVVFLCHRAARLRFKAGQRGACAAKIAIVCVATSLPCVATRVAAAPRNDPDAAPGQKWDIDLGIGMLAAPKYPGARKLDVTPLPLVSVTYDERFFVSTRQGIGAYVVRLPNFRLGASFGIATDTRYTSNDPHLRGLPKIKPGGQANLFAEYDLGPLAVKAALHQRIGPVNGLSATLGTTYRVRLTNDWSVMAGPELKFLSSKLNDAFFGVTQAASRNAAAYGNKIAPYNPGAGIETVSLSIASRYQASEHWSVLARADLGLLVGRDGNSPITRQRLQPEVGLFAMYGF